MKKPIKGAPQICIKVPLIHSKPNEGAPHVDGNPIKEAALAILIPYEGGGQDNHSEKDELF